MEPRPVSTRLILGAGLIGLIGLVGLVASCSAMATAPQPLPPAGPLVSTTVGHIEHIADDAPACVAARAQWRRTVEEFTRTHVMPTIPVDPLADRCRQ